ncbi:Mpv17/PMP22 family protein [Cerasicoccus arenae]|uniref:Mpv17/PMP22 family protein n=1 Tax=Cerasicoccus arenae TaxID=424488 RepID=UPI00167AC7EB|nr:Mpv17/PMP22 family protein [Cerasicoccus arenae]MBK1859387.1 Mpv17/PMP22 family protein [Cerasicoccus arenae]
MRTHPIQWRAAINEGIAAAKANLIPGALLIFCGILLVVGYYQVEAVRNTLDWVGELQKRFGPAFAIPSTAFFGGVLPLVFRRVFLKESSRWQDYLFQSLFWGEKGLEVYFFYKMQAALFGHSATWQSILPKVLVDQLIYVPLVAVPSMVLGYLWKACGYSIADTRAALLRRSYWERSIPVMISNWGVWTPAVIIIYTFPLALQLPLENLILTIWVMLVILLTRERRAA